MYYKDPLKAAYMAREFGVKYNKPKFYKHYSDYISARLFELWNGSESERRKGFKLTVHPDSEHIFEPQEGDLTEWSGGKNCEVRWRAIVTNIENCLTNEKIIQRDNKAFFTPESE